MMYFMFQLLKTILYMEQKWSKILKVKEIELNNRQKHLDTLLKLFDILTIRKDDIPETGDFILRFKRFDIVNSKPGENISKYVIIEEDRE